MIIINGIVPSTRYVEIKTSKWREIYRNQKKESKKQLVEYKYLGHKDMSSRGNDVLVDTDDTDEVYKLIYALQKGYSYNMETIFQEH